MILWTLSLQRWVALLLRTADCLSPTRARGGGFGADIQGVSRSDDVIEGSNSLVTHRELTTSHSSQFLKSDHSCQPITAEKLQVAPQHG